MNNYLIDHLSVNLIAIIIALPMIIAPVIAVFGGKVDNTRWASWILTFFVTGLIFSFSSYLMIDVIRYGPVSYFFGNWPEPVGIEYEITELNALLVLLISGIAFLILPSALDSVEKEIPKEKTPLFYACFLMCLSGLLGMAMSNDLFNIFVFLEISSLTTYALIAMGKNNSSLKSAFHYLIVGTVGATFYLTGVGFLYIETGSLNLSDIAQILANFEEYPKSILAGFTFIIIGLGVKAGLVPMASWLVRSYADAPSFVSAFLASTSTKVALLILIKILYILFGMELSFNQISVDNLLVGLSILAMLYGSLAAFMQNNVKRIFAFSSLSNIGYMVFAVVSLGNAGIIAALFHMISHAVAKAGIFSYIGIIFFKSGGVDLEKFKNYGRKAPLMTACFVIFCLSLIGIPLTSGFVSKWYLINSAFDTPVTALVIVTIAISSLLTVFYCWKIIDVTYSGRQNIKPLKIPYHSQVTVISLAALTIILGVAGVPVINYLTEVSEGLIR